MARFPWNSLAKMPFLYDTVRVKVLLLLAGQSKRFWPLREKSLFPICGGTLLEHQIARLRSAGLTDILLVGGAHNLAPIQALYPTIPACEQERLELGMRGALLSALPQCGDEPVMVVSGNDVISPNGYVSLLRVAEGKGVSGALLARRVERYFPGGYLTLKGERITGIIEKPGEGKEPSDLVNIVAHVHKSPAALLEALQRLDESRDDGYEQALQKLFDVHEYRASPYEGDWQAVKYPWHLLSLLPMFLEEITAQTVHPTASVHPTAVITGNVALAEGVKVLPHATIVGPCYVGKNSIIANNALVRGSSVGEECVVGFSSEIKASILHSHVWTHMGYIGDSIIGHNVSFGGGSTTGNLRLDEEEISSVVGGEKIATGLTKFGTAIGDHCRFGIHTSINPGIKIGGGTFVSSGSLLEEDIPDGSFARMHEGALHISKNRVQPPDSASREQYRSKVAR